MERPRIRLVIICLFSIFPFWHLGSAHPTPDFPVFHGLKLGVPIGEQLSECQYEKHLVVVHSNESLCVDVLWHDGDSGFARVYREYALRRWEEESTPHSFGAESDSDLQLLYASDSDNPMAGKVESVEWTQGYKQQLRVSDALRILKEKYGQSVTCKSESTRLPGSDFSFRDTKCSWVLPWGRIHFKGTTMPGPADYIDVTAQTNRYIEFLSEQKKNDSRKLKEIF